MWSLDIMVDVSRIVRECFLCEENPRLEGDFLCRSCKEEHPMCYDCGQRRRNFPFKLCEKCYGERRSRDTGMVDGFVSISTPSSGVIVSDDSRNGSDGGLAATHDDSDDDGASSSMNKLSFVCSDSEDDAPTVSSKVLYPLQSDQNTYKEIAKHFTQEWIKLTDLVKSPPQPVAIFGIQNRGTEKKFKDYSNGIRQKKRRSNSDLFFHGTKLLCNLKDSKVCCDDSECGICCICLRGFDASRIGMNIPRFQRFGKGIYLAPNSSKCHDYTQGSPQFGLRAQLLCLVAQGAKHELLQDNTKLTEAPEGFDCVYGRKGGSLNYDEVVVYDADAVWPQYVVVYELNGVGKIAK